MSTTETAAARFAGIETWDTAAMVEAMLEGQLAAVAAVHAERTALARAIDAAAPRLALGGRLIYLGAGTSGRIATLDAAELAPTFSWPRDRALAVMAGGPRAVTEAVEGAEDDGPAAAAALDALGCGADDVVIALAASGRTPFALAGLRHARSLGALAVAVLNNPGAPLADAADIAIAPATGAEVLAGSTRMKAGTAQKAVLTVLSTGIFLKLGYVYRGRMVEMVPTNAKLHRRAVEMLMELAECDVPQAETALAACDHSIKTAVVMLRRNLSRAQAMALLDSAGGRLHAALAAADTDD